MTGLLLARQNNYSDDDKGYSLPVVLAATSILILSTVALAVAGTKALQGSSRQYQGVLAEDIAESGASETVERLNRGFRYLLIENIGSWNATPSPVSVCPGSVNNSGTMPTSGTISSASGSAIGKYFVEDYTFQGNRFYGGIGKLRVRGEILNSSGRVAASSTVTQEIDILPKNCGGTFGSPPNTSGFPGLMAKNISLGNADVLGNVSGNILCTGCISETAAQLETEIGKLPQSVVNGNIFGGVIPLPPVPSPPPELESIPGAIITTTRTFTAGTTNGGSCYVNTSTERTYCKISSIDLRNRGEQLTFVTSYGPIDVYISGNVNVSGVSAIAHSGSYKNLTFYGRNDNGDNVSDQVVVLNGGTNAINAFFYMPDASIGINGGSASPDLRGAIWSREFGVVGSSSNMADIQIPDDFGKGLTEDKGDEFNISIRDFKGAGTRFWSTHTN